MSKWFVIGFVIISEAIYRSFFDSTTLGSLIIGIIAGLIGGLFSAIYDHYLGKYDFNVIYFIDNILWFVLFCIPGLFVGAIVSALFEEHINGSIEATIIIIVMLLVSLPLTYRKLKAKQRERMMDINED